MNRRFNLRIESADFGDYGIISDKKLVLQLRVPFKWFKKIKYVNMDVYSTYAYLLPDTIILKTDIEEYLVRMFNKERQKTKRDRVLEKLQYKNR